MMYRSKSRTTRSGMRARLLWLNRTFSWIWLTAMCVLVFSATSRHTGLSYFVLTVAILTELYLVLHASIGIWAYRLPRLRATRFHIILYSGYSILFLLLAGIFTRGFWRTVNESIAWVAILIHTAVASWGLGTRYRLSPLIRKLLLVLVISLIAAMAFHSLHMRSHDSLILDNWNR